MPKYINFPITDNARTNDSVSIVTKGIAPLHMELDVKRLYETTIDLKKGIERHIEQMKTVDWAPVKPTVKSKEERDFEKAQREEEWKREQDKKK